MLKEFKKFISKGNVIDLAIGVVIGAAFGKIVTSLVEDIIMPVIGIIIGGFDFTKYNFTIGEAIIKYGSFIQNVVNFLIVSFCIFIAVRVLNKLKMQKEKEEEEVEEVKEEPKPEDILLLTEIRDLLKKKAISKK